MSIFCCCIQQVSTWGLGCYQTAPQPRSLPERGVRMGRAVLILIRSALSIQERDLLVASAQTIDRADGLFSAAHEVISPPSSCVALKRSKLLQKTEKVNWHHL